MILNSSFSIRPQSLTVVDHFNKSIHAYPYLCIGKKKNSYVTWIKRVLCKVMLNVQAQTGVLKRNILQPCESLYVLVIKVV